jgi:hypothetical protein
MLRSTSSLKDNTGKVNQKRPGFPACGAFSPPRAGEVSRFIPSYFSDFLGRRDRQKGPAYPSRRGHSAAPPRIGCAHSCSRGAMAAPPIRGGAKALPTA